MIRRRIQRGFTLVEMMVVVAIVAILATLMVMGLSTRPYGANTQVIADQVTQTFSFAKLRAISTRRYHRVEVTPTKLVVYQGNTTGMVAPTVYQYVRTFTIPNQRVTVWNTSTTVQVAPGASVSQNPSLLTNIDFRPDGSSVTGGTVFLSDVQQVKKYRVLVYKVTGSSYARQSW